MSNWNRVIVTWSGTDESMDDEFGQSPAGLVDELVARLMHYADMKVRSVVYPCGTRMEDGSSVGDSCCEGLAVFSANHFQPQWAQTVLKRWPWECPGDVQILWKDEEDDVYRAWTCTEPIHWPYGGDPPPDWEGETGEP